MDDEYSSNNSNNDSVSVMPVSSFANQFVSVNSSANSNSSVNGGGSSRGGSASGGGGGTSIEGIRGKDAMASRSTSFLLLLFFLVHLSASPALNVQIIVN